MTVKDAEANNEMIKYPKSVFFIIVNEFCERFSYYGMRTILPIYLSLILGYSEDNASVIYHLFTMLCYFTPVFGAILADTYAGKFRTILYLSILYGCGNILLSVSAIPNMLPQEAFSLIGLFIIAIGTGGIKPCVSAFGGDQFVRPQQDRQLEQFFSIFYMAINAGSFISTLLTPILRENIKCFDQNTCFPLAFGVPAALMAVAVIVFVAGKPLYKIKETEGNIMVDVVKCMSHAIGRKIKHSSEKHQHWLDFASDKFDKQLIEDIKQVLNIVILYLPIPFFWTLFDQQGSRWTFQATRMDGTLGEHVSVKPDQLQIVNALMILLLVPIFDSIVYPIFTKYNLLTPLQRIVTGGLIAALAFTVSGFVELQLEPTYPQIPAVGLTRLDFINTLPCPVKFNYRGTAEGTVDLNATSFKIMNDLRAEPYDIEAEVVFSSDRTCDGIEVKQARWKGTITGASEKGFSVLVTIREGELLFKRMDNEMTMHKSTTGQPRIGFIFNLDDDPNEIVNITLVEATNSSVAHYRARNTINRIVQTEVKDVEIGTYDVRVSAKGSSSNSTPGDVFVSSIKLLPGACYLVVIQRSLTDSAENHLWTVPISPPNSLHMLWLIPQFFLITVAEVMFSVTGLHFSFSQAPERMRSVMQAIWLLTVAFGNLIFIVIAKAKAFDKQSYEFFLFAGLMVLDMAIFVWLSMGYKYVETKPTKKNDEKEDGSENQAYDDTAM